MAFYYIKSGGTATGDGGRYTTQKTGTAAFATASEYYDDFTAARSATTAPTASDLFLASDLHDKAGTTRTLSGLTVPSFLRCVSVDDANCEQYKAGATEKSLNGGHDLNLSGSLRFDGMRFEINDNFIAASANTNVIFNDSVVEGVSSNFSFGPSQDGSSFILINTDVELTGASPGSIIAANNGCLVEWYGGSLITALTGISAIDSSDSNGGGTVKFFGVDLGDVDTYLLNNSGGGSNDDTVQVLVSGCNLGAGLTAINEETFLKLSQRLTVEHSSSSSAGSEYQFHIEAYGGAVDDQADSGIHRDESTAFPSGTKVSARCVTDANASPASSFWFDLLRPEANLSSASTDTLRLYLASTTSLTDADVWAEVIYPDGTNNNISNFISSRNTDLISAGTALTTDSGSTWKDGVSDLVGYNEYYIDVDTSGDPGADSFPLIRIYVALASTTVYFDTTVDVVA